ARQIAVFDVGRGGDEREQRPFCDRAPARRRGDREPRRGVPDRHRDLRAARRAESVRDARRDAVVARRETRDGDRLAGAARPVPSAPSRLERQATARVRTPSCASTAVAARATTSSSNTGVPVAGAVIVTCGRRDGSCRKVTTSRGGLPDSRLWYLTASADTLVRAKLYVPSRVTAAPTRKSTRCPCTTGVLSASSSAPLIVGRFMYVVVASDQVLLLIRRTA